MMKENSSPQEKEIGLQASKVSPAFLDRRKWYQEWLKKSKENQLLVGQTPPDQRNA